MNELELIVQRMIDAGESENNIAAVVKEYNSTKAGKTTPPQEEQGAAAEVISAPEIQPTVTDSKPEDISLESPEIDTKEKKELEQEAGRKIIAATTPVPEALVPTIASIGAFAVNAAGGIVDFVEKYGYAPMKAIIKAGGIGTGINTAQTIAEYEKISSQNNIDISEVYDFSEKIEKLKIKKFDEQGNEQDVLTLIQKRNYSDAAELAINEAIGSAPSLALSIAFPVAGSAVLGMSTAGQEFEKELKERPKESIAKIAGASLLKGVAETATEYLGGVGARYVGGLTKTNTSKKVIKDFTSNYFEKGFKSVAAAVGGFLTEGSTEGLTSLAQTFVDDKIYEDEIDSSVYWREAANSAIIGGLLGGPVGGGAKAITISNIDKQSAYKFIAPQKWKNDISKINLNILDAKQNLQASPKRKKKQFQNQIEVLEQQKQKRLDNLTNAFDGLTRKELLKYTNNISIIDDAVGQINNNKYTLAQQKTAEENLQKAARENEYLVSPNFFDAEIEKSISKELKNKEVLFERGEKVKGVKPNELDIIEITPDEAEKITQDQDAKFSDGFFLKKSDSKDGKAKLYIIPEVAAKTGATNVYAHEMLHYIMSKKFKTDNESIRPLIDSFKNYLSELKVKDQKQGYILDRVQQRIDENYKDSKGQIKKGALEEYMNVFSDLIANEKIIIEESLTNKLKSTFKQYFNGLGFGNIKLDTGKDIFNFIKNYTKNVNSNNKLIKFGFIDPKIISKKLPKAEDLQLIIKKSSSQKASEKVQQIYEAQGAANAFDIIAEFKPIVDKIVNKYRDVPGFEYQLLKDEIETGKRGILDMIMDYTPEKAQGAPLAAYINKFLPRRAIEAANRILDTEFTVDVTEAKGVTDTATEEATGAAEEAQIADEIKSLRKEIGLPKELITTVKNAVIKTFGTKLPNPQDPKFRLELQKRFRTELKKPMAKFVGKQEAYESFLRDNFKAIYNKLPQSLINKRFKDFAEPMLDESGKQMRERTAEGKKIFTKKKITPAEFIKYFLGSDVGRSTQGTRKTAIVEAIAEEIAFDATMEVLRAPDVINKYQEIADITGEVLPENFKSIIAKQIDRGEDFKFSKTLVDVAKNEYGLKEQELAAILNEYTLDDLITEYPLIADFIFNEYIVTGGRNREDFLNAIDFAQKYFSDKIKDNISVENVKTVTKEILLTVGRSTRTAAAPTRDKKTNEIIKENILPPLLSTNQGFYNNVLVNIIPKEYLSEESLHVKNGMVFWGEERLSNIIDITDRNIKEKTVQNPKEYREKLDIQAEFNQDILIGLLKSTKVNDRDNLMSLLKLLQMDQRSLVRSAIKAGIIIKNPKLNPIKKGKLARFKFEKLIWEHNSPANVIIQYIEDYFNGKRDLNEVIYKIKSSRVNLIPKTIDDTLNQNKQLKAGEIEGENRYNAIESLLNKHKFDGNNIGNSYNLISPINKKLSKSLNKEFNKILEQSSGVKFTETFSPVRATMMGRGKGKKFFIPYSADDFVGLLYVTLAKGKIGDQQMEWYQENLLRPFSRGIQQYEAAKQKALRDWMELKKEVKKDVPGGLKKQNDSGFTNQDSVRLYIWNKQGMEIPGVLKKDIAPAIKAVRTNPKLKDFAERLMALNPEGYPQPGNDWASGDITTDIVSYINGVKRSEFLTEWKTNVDKIFTDKNKNKLKALYGEAYVEALDNMLYRMENGRNRFKDASKVEKAFMQWTNNSVGAIMFFNARSAVLQTLSAVNFINFSDNNPINAGIAFINQKQYWNDFSELFNSDFLKQRRTGLQTDVNADEIANAAATSKNKARAALSAILKFGFTPTQIADSFAIASGGASFYRNRINTYIKQGLSEKEAKVKAFTDFQEIAEETQQSARPDRISMQQAGALGRLILAFGNTPMQYARLTKKATLDLINGRGDWKTNISKIAYYSVIQNIIFSALQQGLFALLFDDEDDEETRTRLFRIGNSSADTLLRGIGVYGAAAATVKNIILKIIDEGKKSRPDYTKVAIEATSISPPINSKLRKLESAGKTFTYKQSKEKVFTEGFSLENPGFLAAGKVISAGTNLPVDRVVQKMDHINTAMEAETELWQSIALALGWSEWDLGMIEKQTKKSKTPLRKIKKRKVKR